jgi:hypothetical protein
MIANASRALVIGIGGGGDIVGALAVARYAEALGTPFVLGGISWERTVVDSHAGPWTLDDVEGGRRLAAAATLADAETRTPTGVRFGESLMADHLGQQTVLIDPTPGPKVIAASIVIAAQELECDLVLYVDVGGDVLAHGDERGLGSPLCDAVLLAAACHAAPDLSGAGAVIGPGCDGELTVAEVLDRLAVLATAGAWLGSASVGPTVTGELERAAQAVPTEASLQVARCARGEQGRTSIRGGRRSLELGPIGALMFFYDPEAAVSHGAPLARAVMDAQDLTAAHSTLTGMGIRTELDFEREKTGRERSERQSRAAQDQESDQNDH